MNVLIIGGSRTGSQLAKELLKENHVVHIIEGRKDVLARMHHELPTEIIYEGDFVDPVVLEQAGIHNAQVLAAVTASDEINLLLCYIARETYKVKRTIARVNDPGNSWLFNDIFHVDVFVNHAEIMSRLIEEEMSMGDMMTLLKLRRGNYSLVEEKIPEGAPSIGFQIKELGLTNCVVAAIIRKGELIVPRGVTKLEAGDEVLAVTNQEGAKQLAKLLAAPDDEEKNRLPPEFGENHPVV
jgi:trk system potassium uptake protein